MQWPDFINGVFEAGMSGFICLSIRKLYQDKIVRGFSPWHIAFPTAWGYWNLYYYPSLDQWWSFYGGIAVVTVNTIYLLMIRHYKQREKLAGNSVLAN